MKLCDDTSPERMPKMESTMIMILTHRSEIRERLTENLHAKGYETCVPEHREDVVGAMKDRQPDVIVLDLYLAEPSGAEVLRRLRQDGYHGRVIVLSGESMVPVLHDVQSLGIDKVMHLPARIGERFDFGELLVAIEAHEPLHHHARIARRAYELYQKEGYREGRDVQNWTRAEQELAR
jgi:two-component system nitrogen regulation response regulator NtrX